MNSNKKDIGSRNEHKKSIYVWVSSHKAIFLVVGDIKESKFSYGVPIIPLVGYYRSKGKTYNANELRDYYVILNLPKDVDIDELKGKKVVVVGYDAESIYIDENEDANNDNANGEDGNVYEG